MEGNVIERRTSTVQGIVRQSTMPTPTTPTAHIFVTPPPTSDAEHRPRLEKMPQVDAGDATTSKIQQVKDPYEGKCTEKH